MKLENFQVDADGISLNWQGQNLDLHNCFDFQSILYDVALRQVELTWQRSTEEWARNTTLSGLKLIFQSVSFFRVRERDAAFSFTEDDCLMNVSFHPSELRDEFDSVSRNSAPTDDLTFFFQSEWGFKINSAAVALVPLP